MRILVCAAYTPYPPRGGGRADIWRRIEAFVRLGHSVMLLHQFDPDGILRPEPEHLAGIDEVVDARYSLELERTAARTLRQLLSLRRLPWHVANAVPKPAERKLIDAAVNSFRPDLIWLDGPVFGELAQRYSAAHGAAIAYRSHNIEHLYLRRQANASRRWRQRISWSLAAVGLKRYETDLMRRADRVLDISVDDLSFWRSQGIERIQWLPPLPELALAEPPREVVEGDVVFVGGLSLPNNVQGVRWLIDEVMPLVRTEDQTATLTVVGSSPREPLRADLAAVDWIRTHFDVPSVQAHLMGARVLVNPVSIGSGVQLKMLDMLTTDAPIVTRTQGTRGLPDECVSEFSVADDAEQFARRILDARRHPANATNSRVSARSLFSLQAIETALAGLGPSAVGDQTSRP